SGGTAVSLTNTGGANRAISVVGNNLSGNSGHGIAVDSGAMSGSLQAHFNRIVGDAGDGVNNAGADPVDATNNWWGCNEGPNATGCETVSGANVVSAPWLKLTANAERGRILTNGDTNRITAGFVNSNNEIVDLSQLPPITVTFATP